MLCAMSPARRCIKAVDIQIIRQRFIAGSGGTWSWESQESIRSMGGLNCPGVPAAPFLERLSSESSDSPRPSVPEHGIQDREELPHSADDGHCAGTARGHEAVKERPGSLGCAATVAMYRLRRTCPRPPTIIRRPRKAPLSRATGASPARAAMRRRSRWPGSGKSALRAHEVAGPTPGTERSRADRARHILERLAAVAPACRSEPPKTARFKTHLRDAFDRGGRRARPRRGSYSSLRQQPTGPFEHQNHGGLLWALGTEPAARDCEPAG
jgi:hypothetical protein